MGEFSLSGKTDEKDGKFAAIIVLHTPDGKQTKIESGYIYQEKEAEYYLKQKIDAILKHFKDERVEVLSHIEGVVQ